MLLLGRDLVKGAGLAFRAESEAQGPVEILLYDVIGRYYDWDTGELAGIDAKDFVEQLAQLKGRELLVRLNSRGGIVSEGVAIYNALRRHDAAVNVAIDGQAHSIASIIAMAGRKISMAENATMMIHCAWTVAMGNADEFRKLAVAMDALDESLMVTYARRSQQPEDEVMGWMRSETWMTARQCQERGFCDSIVDGATEVKAMAPARDPKRLRALTREQLDALRIDGVDIEKRRERQTTMAAKVRLLRAEIGT